MELSCAEVPLYVSSTTLGFCPDSRFLLGNGSFKSRVKEIKTYSLAETTGYLMLLSEAGTYGDDGFQYCGSILWSKFNLISPLWSLFYSPSVVLLAVFKSRVTYCLRKDTTHSLPQFTAVFFPIKFQITIVSTSSEQKIVYHKMSNLKFVLKWIVFLKELKWLVKIG